MGEPELANYQSDYAQGFLRQSYRRRTLNPSRPASRSKKMRVMEKRARKFTDLTDRANDRPDFKTGGRRYPSTPGGI